MKSIKKHHSEHLDGTRGAWRPSVVGSSILGPDGHPASFGEVVVFSCPGCGAQQGVGTEAVKIQPDGTTDGPVKCYHCPWSDVLQFEKHAEAEGREHFNRMIAQAHQDVSDARIRKLHEKIKTDMQQELAEKAMAEVRKILPEGAENHAELYRDAMKRLRPGPGRQVESDDSGQ